MEKIELQDVATSLNDALHWRYATKHFDSEKTLSTEQVNTLLSAIQLAPTSYGLQPFKILVVTDKEIREKLKQAAYNQTQVTDASALLVFATYKNFTAENIDEYAQNIVETRGIKIEDIAGFVDVMKGQLSRMTQEQVQVWNAKQAYIALGFLLETAALEQIDACPMEGFNMQTFDEILGLADKNLQSVVIAPIGYRSTEDTYQHYKKVRKSKEDLFIHV